MLLWAVCAAAVATLVGCGEHAAPPADVGDSPAAVGGGGLSDDVSGAGDASGLLDVGSGSGDGSGAADAGHDTGHDAGGDPEAREAVGVDAVGAGPAAETPGPDVGAVSAQRAPVLEDDAGSTDAGDRPDGGSDSGRGDPDSAVQSGVDAAGSGDGSQFSSVEATDEAATDLPGPLRIQYEPGGLFLELGSLYWPDRYELDVFRDEVAVRADSVLVDGGVVRGLVQNMSERLFARHVTVSVGDGRWVVPLTVQPGEVVPFVIEGYGGSSDPESIRFEVSAKLVAEPDLRRSFEIFGLPGIWADTWEEIGWRVQAYDDVTAPEGLARTDLVSAYETLIEFRAPTSHPSVAGMLEAGQAVGDLRVYWTKMDGEGRVLAVREMVPYEDLVWDASSGRHVGVPVARVEEGSLFYVTFLPEYGEKFAITVGGVHDGAG